MKNNIPSFSNLAHTYSIVARDAATGELGVAVQSHWFSVGSVVSWAEAGVGAIATQSLVNISFGPRGLDLLRQGHTAQQTVELLIQSDTGRDLRQLAIVDASGGVAAYTGARCIAAAGHLVGEDFSVQANLMLNEGVWPAMAETFRQSEGPLPERMVAALAAGQTAGGDIRGKQSAAILVVRGQASGQIWQDRLLDLRVEDHAEPVQELQRLLHIFRAYEFMNAGDEALEQNDVEAALPAYRTAETMLPDNPEMKFWHAVALTNVGRLAEALPIFSGLFALDSNWATLIERLRQSGLLQVDEAAVAEILGQR
jgi:uncharacterized Ntn-hydrolase superfamily protein